MKKTCTLILLVFIIYTVQAQIRTFQPLKKHVLATSSRATGDTLMYMPLVDMYINPTDNAGFTYTTEDLDGLMPFNPSYIDDFGVFFSADTVYTGPAPGMANFYHPWENPATDSSFFWGATSYFTPPGTANNWLMFGPLTIPATGATLIWYDKTQRYKDGYEVLLTTSTAPSVPQTSSDFFDPAIYSEADDSMPSATYAQDTLWEYKSIVIPPSYNGQLVSFAFHHTATDMDILFLDEITLIEGTAYCNSDFTVVQDTANAFNYFVYNNSSSGGSYSYLWDFGDSTTSTLQYPTHNYSWAGPFQLCLTVSDTSGCSDIYCDSINAGHSSTPITVTVVAPLVTGVAEEQTANSVNIYPNPLRSSATVKYTTSKNGSVEISVLDLLGNKIEVLEAGNKQEGTYELPWNVEGLSKGMYLLQLRTGENTVTKKIIITN